MNKHRSSAAAQDPSGTGAIAKSGGDFEIPRRGSSGDESERLRKKRVQIHSLKEIPADGNYNSPDVQFILEVKRSNIKVNLEIDIRFHVFQQLNCAIGLVSRIRR